MAPQIPFLEEKLQRLKDWPGSMKKSYQEFNCINCMKQFRSSNRMLVLVVFIAIYIDNMLTTAVGKIHIHIVRIGYGVLGPGDWAVMM